MAANIWNPGSGSIVANAENDSLIQKFIATAGQTLFALTSFSYVVDTGSIRVYRNGNKLQQSEVGETSDTTFTLIGIVLAAGEIIEASAVLGSQDAVTAAALSASASAASASVSAASAAAVLVNAVQRTATTGSVIMPGGTTLERDTVPQLGYTRVNTDTFEQEWWNGTYWAPLGGGQMLGTAAVKAISYNAQTIAENITISGVNAGSFGPITIEPGFAVTIDPGATWSIV